MYTCSLKSKVGNSFKPEAQKLQIKHFLKYK